MINKIKNQLKLKKVYTQKYIDLKESAENMRLQAKNYTHRAIAKKHNVSASYVQQIAEGYHD